MAMTEGSRAQNPPEALARKESGKPLIDTGDMRTGVTGAGRKRKQWALKFAGALRKFRIPLPVRVHEIMGGYLHGGWQETETKGSARDIEAIVLAMPGAILESYRERNASVSGITLTMAEQLFFTDVNNAVE